MDSSRSTDCRRILHRRSLATCSLLGSRHPSLFTWLTVLFSVVSVLSVVWCSIVRAFLIEEQKIVKAVLKQRGGAKKAAAVSEK